MDEERPPQGNWPLAIVVAFIISALLFATVVIALVIWGMSQDTS
jgi:hypothetical protein